MVTITEFTSQGKQTRDLTAEEITERARHGDDKCRKAEAKLQLDKAIDIAGLKKAIEWLL